MSGMRKDQAIIESERERVAGIIEAAVCNDMHMSKASQRAFRTRGKFIAADALLADREAREGEMRAEIERLREAFEETARYWRGEHARLCNSLVGIRRAADARRAEKDGERHQYYYHTADATLNGNSGFRALTESER